ncbi:DUF3575 domain-containing protein [Tenacibaculum maritimum]|uniref:DUF3575 domain-containing protein n=1 Tax=Tenacibaculum maritimum NCIMB 2154 TaxID=1349785 RepID=A0A2H1E5Z0_9FLAO|nr:DUF3575 domain-containing protein [Tenacibaculum maritimum]MCD9584081.1 DUF3575 domain-containing protein [Tenacibaculum maritimum]MCD9619873.1 DUF3575 domain-containing protein [Tenacibaculum maritimum]MCD9627370.1 DUF3575 domain-containing protein [Tenacibaculum maritimum]MCD9630424.1 DUF3575 domain-containing protein [Tenacibaculum maritimum]MCD9633602.1 DUF3575 domain-containing protein [Tenacibaculum maritimum]
MKKIVILIAILGSSFAKAQQEVKADLFDALAYKTIEISYEYYIGDQSSVGASVLLNFEKRGAGFFVYNEHQMITPYFRHYFTASKNWNYFGEVFLGINTGEKEIKIDGKVIDYKDYTDGALGVAGGTKYISNGGFVIDIYAGLGRNMFSSSSPSVVPRVGVNLGYRF